MALKLPEAGGVVKFLIVGMVVLFLISNIININAFGKGTCDKPAYTTSGTCENANGVWTSAEIFKPDVPYDTLIPQVYKWLIVGMAAWLAWKFTIGGEFEGRMDRKKFVTLAIMAVVLYFVYNKVIVGSGLIPGLNPIEFAVYQLQSMMVP